MAHGGSARRRRSRWRLAFDFLVGWPLALVGLWTLYGIVVVPWLPEPVLPDRPGMSIDQRLRDALEIGGMPGIGAAVVTPPDKVAIYVAGRRERGGETSIAPDDPWHLGSDAKAMVAAVYARLVERGRARWEATVPELFPDLAAIIDPAWSTVTIEALLSHRAGVRDTWLRLRLLPMHFDRRPGDLQRTAIARRILASPPAGTPGEFAYSNVSYVVAGAAMERITGLGFEETMAQELFLPLGLASAGFGAPVGAAPRGHGRGWLPFIGHGPVDPAGFADNPSALGPAGRIHMSLADWARFVAVVLKDGDGFLRKASVDRLLATPGQVYALGWGRAEGFNTPVFVHSGSNTMWFVTAMMAPERGVAVLVATNDGADGVQPVMGSLARQLLADGLRG